MTNVMTYKGYKACVEYDGEDEIFTGHVDGIDDVVGFHATSVKDLKRAFRETVTDYIEICRKPR